MMHNGCLPLVIQYSNGLEHNALFDNAKMLIWMWRFGHTPGIITFLMLEWKWRFWYTPAIMTFPLLKYAN